LPTLIFNIDEALASLVRNSASCVFGDLQLGKRSGCEVLQLLVGSLNQSIYALVDAFD
jgi:hypothetical protein